IAIEGNLSVYEYIHEGLFRLQIGYDKKRVNSGILLVNKLRGGQSPYNSVQELVGSELESLEETISLPVAVALFDLV
ncbi:MAG: hypothetical protein L7F78_08665, partial [Syntrophales bacterium LBB04]|nr:hypothetical protein [Syntrophales bacterium LBB04]